MSIIKKANIMGNIGQPTMWVNSVCYTHMSLITGFNYSIVARAPYVVHLNLNIACYMHKNAVFLVCKARATSNLTCSALGLCEASLTGHKLEFRLQLRGA